GFGVLVLVSDITQDPSSQSASTSASSEVQQEHQLRDSWKEEVTTNAMTFYNPDPAKWILTERLIDYIAQNGSAQNLKLDFKLTKRMFGDKARFLNKNDFIRKMANGEVKPRKWLIYSESTKKVFCGPCRLFSADAAFAKEGVDEWKNLKKLLMIHENSTNHKFNLLLIKVRGSKLGRIDKGLTEAIEEEVSYWQNVLRRVVVVKVELDLAEAVNLLKSLASFFLEIRKDFDGHEIKGMELCGLISYKIKREQIRKIKTDEIRDNEEIYFNERDKFRIHTFYTIIDKLLQKWTGLTIGKAFCHDIENDIIEELVHLQCHLKSLNLGSNRVAIPENPRTLLNWLKEKELQDIYPNVEILLRIFNTLPISNTSAERSFSVLKRIKNLYRTSMIQERVSVLALLCIEGEFTRRISFEGQLSHLLLRNPEKKTFLKL
ncbi:hypothetical protein NQ314_008503, partial [Rhamnusium bicolor]